MTLDDTEIREQTRVYHKKRKQEDKEIVRSTYKALVLDPDIGWVRDYGTGDIGPVHSRELWIPSVQRWVRTDDMAISGCGRYVYPGIIWRWLYRRALAVKGLPRE